MDDHEEIEETLEPEELNDIKGEEDYEPDDKPF